MAEGSLDLIFASPCCGKSTLQRLCGERGIHVFDTDDLDFKIKRNNTLTFEETEALLTTEDLYDRIRGSEVILCNWMGGWVRHFITKAVNKVITEGSHHSCSKWRVAGVYISAQLMYQRSEARAGNYTLSRCNAYIDEVRANSKMYGDVEITGFLADVMGTLKFVPGSVAPIIP